MKEENKNIEFPLKKIVIKDKRIYFYPSFFRRYRNFLLKPSWCYIRLYKKKIKFYMISCGESFSEMTIEERWWYDFFFFHFL